MYMILIIILLLLFAITGIIVIAACALSAQFRRQGQEWENPLAGAMMNKQQVHMPPVNMSDKSSQAG